VLPPDFVGALVEGVVEDVTGWLLAVDTTLLVGVAEEVFAASSDTPADLPLSLETDACSTCCSG
jgi:hypothetical protein